MFLVKFPHRVKIDGEYYAANTPVRVDNADEYLACGAVVVEETAAAPMPKPAAKRTKKKPEAETSEE